MSKCLLCRVGIARKKYCSKKCVQRAWQARQSPASSFGRNRAAFWKTETGKGVRWEAYVAKQIGAQHLLFNKFGCDLDWNGKAVDVKSANVYKRRFKRGKPVTAKQTGVWVFNRNKEKKVDFFACVCLANDRVEKLLLIPGEQFPPRGMVIGLRSKYDRYRIV